MSDSSGKTFTNKHRLLNNPVVIVGNTIVIFFIAQFIAGVMLVCVRLLMGWNEASFKDWFGSSALPQFMFVIIADLFIFLGVRMFLHKKGQTLKDIGLAKPRWNDASRAILGYGVYLLMFILITIISKKLIPSLNLEQEQQLGFEANKGFFNLLLAGISLVILPPIVEEILCRGYLYTGLRHRYNVVTSAIVTSLVFALAHLQFGGNAPLLWVAAIDTFVLSLVLVYLREKTGRLSASMLLHGLKNLIAFCLLFVFIK